MLISRSPGHVGHDPPATEGLVVPPMPTRVLLAVIVSLSCGVGPPITAVDVALAFAVGRRLFPQVDGVFWVGMGTAGTVGALFGTPRSSCRWGNRRRRSGTSASRHWRRPPPGR